MAELEIDQTNLPRVQEVCQCFAVLEDGALAHNLQEQEIEQYYSTNIQKSQLVQNDIRVAKQLQDEEEEGLAQHNAVIRQASRQLEEQDFEYARLIQEEILRCAEEAQRREQDDEEIAKRMQEEEKQRIRSREEEEESSEGSASEPTLPSPHQHTLSRPRQAEEQYSTSATRWRRSTSHSLSSVSEPEADSHRGVTTVRNTASRSNQGHKDSFREIRGGRRDPLSDDSEDSDTVFSERLSAASQRLYGRSSTAPPRRRASLHHPLEKECRSPCCRSSHTDELRVWEEERGDWVEDSFVNGDLEKRRARDWDRERNTREQCEERQDQEVRGRQCSRSESVSLHDRSRHSNGDLVRTWSYKENPNKHVRFQDNTRSSVRRSVGSSVWEMLGQVLRERGVPVRLGGNGAPLQIGPQRRESQDLHGSEVSCGDSQPQQRAFQRASTSRHSFHGDIRERRRLSHRENSGKDHREDRDRRCNIVEHDGEVYEISSRESSHAKGERGGSRSWGGPRFTKEDTREMNASDGRIKRTASERRPWHKTTQERKSSEEQEVERRREQPRRRAPQRSQSLRSSGASSRDRSKHMAAGASLQPEPSEASFEMGELRQVLKDEELARKLQEEEATLLRRTSQRSPCSPYPQGDFRVAQVAQDEEIAHFMQKQEMKTKRRSRELEGPSSWREHRAMIGHHDRRAARDRQLHRERLDSEGLPSPTEDCFPDNQPPSPPSSSSSATLQSKNIRNVAEELDPTFQARREGTGAGQTAPACQTLPPPHSGVHDLLEETTFIPPTKRQSDKSGRPKPKEKKENCKQQ